MKMNFHLPILYPANCKSFMIFIINIHTVVICALLVWVTPTSPTLIQLQRFEVWHLFLQTGSVWEICLKNSPYFYCSVLVMLLVQKWHTSASRWWLLKSRFAAGFRAQEVFGFVHWKQPCMDVDPAWWQCWTHRVGIAWRWWCSA